MTRSIAGRNRMAALALGLGIALGGAVAAPGPVMAQAAQKAAKVSAGRITVSGQGEVAAAPDMATVTLGVTTDAETAADAMAANSRQLTGVFDALKSAGVAPRDMQTSGLSLGPRWSNPKPGDQKREIVGFTAHNMVTVQVRKLGALGDVLDTLVKAGANNIQGLSFGIDKPGPLQDEARTKAIKDARRKAEMMAAAAGVKLGRVISISEGNISAPRPMYRMATMAESAPVPVAQGEVNLSAQVTMVFALDQ